MYTPQSSKDRKTSEHREGAWESVTLGSSRDLPLPYGLVVRESAAFFIADSFSPSLWWMEVTVSCGGMRVKKLMPVTLLFESRYYRMFLLLIQVWWRLTLRRQWEIPEAAAALETEWDLCLSWERIPEPFKFYDLLKKEGEEEREEKGDRSTASDVYYYIVEMVPEGKFWQVLKTFNSSFRAKKALENLVCFLSLFQISYPSPLPVPRYFSSEFMTSFWPSSIKNLGPFLG